MLLKFTFSFLPFPCIRWKILTSIYIAKSIVNMKKTEKLNKSFIFWKLSVYSGVTQFPLGRLSWTQQYLLWYSNLWHLIFMSHLNIWHLILLPLPISISFLFKHKPERSLEAFWVVICVLCLCCCLCPWNNCWILIDTWAGDCLSLFYLESQNIAFQHSPNISVPCMWANTIIPFLWDPYNKNSQPWTGHKKKKKPCYHQSLTSTQHINMQSQNWSYYYVRAISFFSFVFWLRKYG